MRFSRGRGPRLYTSVCLLLLVVISSAALGGDPDRRIRQVNFVSDGPLPGVSEEALRKLSLLEAGQPFRLDLSQHTIRQIYATDLFHDVQVLTDEVGEEEVDVTVRLIRRFLVEKVELDGNREISDRELRRAILLRERRPYSQEQMDRSISELESLYQNRGYYRPEISAEFHVDREKARLKVIFVLEAGEQARVEQLTLDVAGNLDTEALREEIETQMGGPFSQSQIEEDLSSIRRRLALMGYFQPEVYLRGGADYIESRNSIEVTIRVLPGDRTEVTFVGIELSEEEKSRLPLYEGANPARLLVSETETRLRQTLQEDGFFLAEVVGEEDPKASEVRFLVERGRKYDLKEILFEGNDSIPAADLKRVLQTEESGLLARGELTDETLEQDKERLRYVYQQRGFLDVEISHSFRTDDENLRLLFQIAEGPRHRVRNLTIQGNQSIDTERIEREVSLSRGSHYSPYSVAQDRSQILGLYENRGFRDVAFDSEAIPVGNSEVDLEYRITEGPQYFVEQVVVTGNVETRESVIQREILAEPGTPLSYQRNLLSETNLYDLAVFNRVRFKEISVYRKENHRNVLFSVDEARKYTLFYGLGYSHTFGTATSEGLRGTVGVSNNNFLGMARTLSLSLRAGSIRQRGNLSYIVPRPWGTDFSTVLSFTIDNEERVSRDRDEIQINVRPYDSFRVSGSVQAEKTLSQRESLFARYRYEKVDLTIPENLESPVQFFRVENTSVSAFSLSYLNESRDNPSDPSEGFFLNGEADLATGLFGSQERYFSLLTQGRYYYPLFPDLTLVAALRIGMIHPFDDRGPDGSNPVTISERFFAGGPSTLRGLPLDLAGPLLTNEETGEVILVGPEDDQVPVPLGGNGLVVGNLEFRFPIMRYFGGVLFFDVGNVFDKFSDVIGTDYSSAAGLGLSINTPIGPVRLDAAYNPSPPKYPGFQRWNFHINIGHPF